MQLKEFQNEIENLISQLTLEEKVAMIHGNGLFETGSVERLGIPPLHMSDGPMGVRNEFPRANWVPVGNSDDYVTYCPSNSALASTWNRELVREAGLVMGEEARGRGKDVILGPGINIKRVPVNGRNFEYMSEDPYLISELVVPLIQGIQESDVAACVKHFVLNNQETERLWVNVEIDERALREIYLPGFETAVRKAGSHSLMGAYNLFRGTHCCESRALLGDILRKEWGYDGAVISDWGAVHHTEEAAKSPLDIEMSVTYDFDEYVLAKPLLAAVREGSVSEVEINEKVRHILLLMMRLKMIGAAAEDRKSGCYNTVEHRVAVRKAAEESVILLKNEQKLLPLSEKQVKKLLVIGDNAERLHANGGGSAEIKALYEISPLLGLKSQLGGNTEVCFARGYYVSPKEEDEVSWQEKSTEELAADTRGEVSAEILNRRRELREEAVRLAGEYEHVLLFAGLNHDYDVEGYDRPDMRLPYDQDQLIEEVLAVNPNAIIIMMAGSPVSMERWSDKAKAILWMWYCGMECGNVITDTIFGRVNPSGKLPETIPYRLEDCGAIALGEFPGRPLTEEVHAQMDAHTTETYRDGIFVGYRYYETYGVPVQYEFGYGLSYTTFAYSDVRIAFANGGDNRIAVSRRTDEDEILATVSVRVKNTGTCAGKEIAQLYIGKENSQIDRPVKELKGFGKAALEPGEEQEITFPLTKRSFAYYDVETQAFEVEPGCYQLSVGASVRDLRGIVEIIVIES